MQNAEINDLQEKVLRLEQQLSVKADIPPEQETDYTPQETNYMQQETIDLKSKLQSKVLLLIIVLCVLSTEFISMHLVTDFFDLFRFVLWHSCTVYLSVKFVA